VIDYLVMKRVIIMSNNYSLHNPVLSSFKLSTLFEIWTGSENQNELPSGNTALIATGIANNGVCEYVSIQKEKIYCANSITVSNIDSSAVFYQHREHCLTQNVFSLQPKFSGLNHKSGIYITQVIRKELTKYGWGNYIGKAGLSDLMLSLPSTFSTINNEFGLDVIAMENFINNLENDSIYKEFLNILAKANKVKFTPINYNNWHPFAIDELFNVIGSKTTPVEVLMKYGKGKFPYITTKATNNGVQGHYDFFTENGNCLTVDSAVLGTCFYQKNNFSASDHVELLIPKYSLFNEYHGQFFQALINNVNIGIYNYSHKYNHPRIRATVLRLPFIYDSNGKEIPNWSQIENYIKSM
jgi:hypothetical protein